MKNPIFEALLAEVPEIPSVYQAFYFAAAAHSAIDQRRKYTGDPYIVHPVAVMSILLRVGFLPRVLAAALLHDVVEDTKVTEDQLRAIFPEETVNMVMEVTDVSRPEDGSRATRKKLDREHICKASPGGRAIKLADLIHNTSSITEYAPDFARIYMAEKRDLLDVLPVDDLGIGGKTLYNEASALVRGYFGKP